MSRHIHIPLYVPSFQCYNNDLISNGFHHARTTASKGNDHDNKPIITRATMRNNSNDNSYPKCIEYKPEPHHRRSSSVSEGAWKRSLRKKDPPEKLLPAIPNTDASRSRRFGAGGRRERARSVERLGGGNSRKSSRAQQQQVIFDRQII